MNCTVCGFAEPRLWTVKFGLGEKWSIRRCRGCGFGFVHPRPSADYIHKLYAKYGDLDGATDAEATALMDRQDRRNTTRDANEVFSTARKLLPIERGAKMLDIGAGIGLFSQRAAEIGFDVTMIELSESKGKIATELVGRPPIRESFEAYSESPSHFDLILMSQILEHAIDINSWISKASTLLKKGGLLVVAVPNFDFALRPVLGQSTPYIIPPEHLNFFSRSSLKTLLQNHGFVMRATQGTSRIHPSFIKRKLGRFSILWPLAPLLFTALDPLRRGLFIRAYAEKI